MSKIEDIPDDCVGVILSYLEVNDLISITSTSKEWNLSVVSRSDVIWERTFKNSFEFSVILSDETRKKRVESQETNFRKYIALRNEEVEYRRELMKAKPVIGKEFYDKSKETEDVKKYEILVVGDGAVGKTCLLIRFAEGRFPTDYCPTIYEQFYATMIYDDKYTTLKIQEIYSMEDIDYIRPYTFPGTSVVLICFSLIDRFSFENVEKKWIQYQYPKLFPTSKPKIVLIGTKVDLRDDPTVLRQMQMTSGDDWIGPITTSEGQSMARKIKADGYFETSGLTMQGVTECFVGVIAVAEGNLKMKKNSSDKCVIM